MLKTQTGNWLQTVEDDVEGASRTTVRGRKKDEEVKRCFVRRSFFENWIANPRSFAGNTQFIWVLQHGAKALAVDNPSQAIRTKNRSRSIGLVVAL
jgi:hypothetical protein